MTAAAGATSSSGLRLVGSDRAYRGRFASGPIDHAMVGSTAGRSVDVHCFDLDDERETDR